MMETTVEVRRVALEDGREPWRTYVDGELSNHIEIDEDSTVRLWSDETTLRIYILYPGWVARPLTRSNARPRTFRKSTWLHADRFTTINVQIRRFSRLPFRE